MTTRADRKKQVVIPWVKPGNVVARTAGRQSFFPGPAPAGPAAGKKTKAEVRRVIKNSKLLLDVTWDELRVLTREPGF